MGFRYDPHTGGMIRTKPSPLPADLARAMVEGLMRNAATTGPTNTVPFDRMTPAEQRRWLNAASFAINRMRL